MKVQPEKSRMEKEEGKGRWINEGKRFFEEDKSRVYHNSSMSSTLLRIKNSIRKGKYLDKERTNKSCRKTGRGGDRMLRGLRIRL